MMVVMEVMAAAVAGMLRGGGKYAGEAKRIPKKHVHCSRWWSTSIIKFSLANVHISVRRKRACLPYLGRFIFFNFRAFYIGARQRSAMSLEKLEQRGEYTRSPGGAP